MPTSSRCIKLWAVDMRDHELDKNISNETGGGVKVFIDALQIAPSLVAVKRC